MSGTCAEPGAPAGSTKGRHLPRGPRFFAGSLFAIALLSLLVTFEGWLVALLLFPGSGHGLGAFADEFRTWCFGIDAATGSVAWGRAAVVLSEPLLLAAAVAWLWRPVLVWNGRVARALLVMLLAGSTSAGAATWALAARSTAAPAVELPFPADGLRTALPAPNFSLVDQTGATVALSDLRGRVVAITGIYASCTIACPIIMGQAKAAFTALSPAEQRQVTFLALTLNPAADNQTVLAATAASYAVRSPEFRLLTGTPRDMDAALDALQIARSKRAHSSVIDHASVFVLVDRAGKIAYRLAIGAYGERWLPAALRILIAEPEPAS